MKKVVTIIIICVLFIATGVLAYTTYNLYQENQELLGDLDDLKNEKKSSSDNNNNTSKENANYKEEIKDNTENVVIENKEETNVGEYSNIKEITYSKLSKKILNEETFILLVTQTGCSHCDAYRPVLNKVLKDNNIVAFEIDRYKLTEEEKKSLDEFASVTGTPTTIFFKDGDEVSTLNRLSGNVSSDKISSRLKSLGYIK